MPDLRALLAIEPWAIQPEWLELLASWQPTAAASRPMVRSSGATAVIPLHGPISQRPSFWSMLFGGTSTTQFVDDLRAALADERVRSIVLDVDSPGGTTGGVQEASRVVYEARGQKPITAVVTGMGASAAYHILSAADEVVMSPSAMAGSIGVYMLHEDISGMAEAAGVRYTVVKAGRYKAEGIGVMPLSEDAHAHMQEIVDGTYAQFVADVARNRGTTAEAVRNGYGEGRVLLAADAVAAGLADRVATLDQVLARHGGPDKAELQRRQSALLGYFVPALRGAGGV